MGSIVVREHQLIIGEWIAIKNFWSWIDFAPRIHDDRPKQPENDSLRIPRNFLFAKTSELEAPMWTKEKPQVRKNEFFQIFEIRSR